MPKAIKDLSLADLDKLIKERNRELDKLYKQRDQIDARIAALEKGKRGSKGVKASRAKNEVSLHDTIHQILSKTSKGFTLAEVCDKVKATGYKSNAKNFKNVVYQCMHTDKEVVRVADSEPARYVLKKNSK